MKAAWQVERALQLSGAGWNNCEISRELGVHRRTVSDWVRGKTRAGPRQQLTCAPSCFRCHGTRDPFPDLTEFAYGYLLGLYLGDGWIASHPRGVFRLRVFLDRKYPVIVAECQAAVSIVMPSSKAAVYKSKNENVDEVGAYSRHWLHVFPQHARGVKHERRIALEPWQERIVDRHPGRLLRGLIHSDGCRVLNRIHHPKKTYTYPRYLFTNRSLDIQQIFCNACDRLGIAWREDGPWNISIARREAVAIMDRHVGPKR